MTLREQLAERLRLVANAALDAGDDSDAAYAHVGLSLADECIRQMEWAWNCGHAAAEDGPYWIATEDDLRRSARFDECIEGATPSHHPNYSLGGEFVIYHESYPLLAAPDDWLAPVMGQCRPRPIGTSTIPPYTPPTPEDPCNSPLKP